MVDSNDNNREEAAELVATIRGEHVVMKNWFNNTDSNGGGSGGNSQVEILRNKYGPYPSLWKEVLNWPGYKEVRKAYLQHTQKKESSGSGSRGSGENTSSRKRRSRWGTAADTDEGTSNNGNNKRRSRWGSDEGGGGRQELTSGGPSLLAHSTPTSGPTSTTPTASQSIPGAPFVGGLLPGMPTNLSPQQQEQMRNMQSRLRVINEKLENLESEAARVDALPRGHRERSPSPPPVYGPDGKRKNTRAIRWKERYSTERHDILEQLMNMNPANNLRGVGGKNSALLKRKRVSKITIPVDEHPTYNFIGLIIGPRGKTQKELESKTGCKIAIRGRGSVKEGARGRRDGKICEGDNEPLHVVITGDDVKSVNAATDMIQQMLIVIDDEKNVHKQQQLRELALLNGTLKEDEYCQLCAEKGHRSFECPKRFTMNNKANVTVKCAICGDTSHPTRDCTQKKYTNDELQQKMNPQELDSDYTAFMAELEGKKVDNKHQLPPPASGGQPSQPVQLSAPGTVQEPSSVTAAPGVLAATPTTLPPPTGLDTSLPPPPMAVPPSASLLPPPPPPPPPPPVGLPPPPATSIPANTAAPQVVGPPPTTVLQPPPSSVPVGQPHHYQHQQNGGVGANYYGTNEHRPQQQSYQQQQNNYHGQNLNQYNNSYGNAGQQQQYPSHHNQQQPSQPLGQGQQQYQQQQQQHQQQQQQQAQGGDGVAGWDYRSYYGQGSGGGDAGGFNWWG